MTAIFHHLRAYPAPVVFLWRVSPSGGCAAKKSGGTNHEKTNILKLAVLIACAAVYFFAGKYIEHKRRFSRLLLPAAQSETVSVDIRNQNQHILIERNESDRKKFVFSSPVQGLDVYQEALDKFFQALEQFSIYKRFRRDGCGVSAGYGINGSSSRIAAKNTNGQPMRSF